MRKESWTLGNLVAVIPEYTGTGYGTRILTQDGDVQEVRKSPRVVLQHAMQKEGVSWKSYIVQYKDHPLGKQYLPVVCGGVAFMTAQLCKSCIYGDDLYGFIRVDMIETITEEQTADGLFGAIQLYSGQVIHSRQSIKTVLTHYNRAVGDLYQSEARKRREQALQWERWYRSVQQSGRIDELSMRVDAVQGSDNAQISSTQTSGQEGSQEKREGDAAYVREGMPVASSTHSYPPQFGKDQLQEYYQMKSVLAVIKQVTTDTEHRD